MPIRIIYAPMMTKINVIEPYILNQDIQYCMWLISIPKLSSESWKKIRVMIGYITAKYVPTVSKIIPLVFCLNSVPP